MQTRINDGGRLISKRARQINDCVVRAVAIASGRPYDSIYDELAALGRKSGRSTPKKIWQPYLNDMAQKISFPAIKGENRMNLSQFSKIHPSGKFVIQFAGHLAAVVDGLVHDNFVYTSRDFGRCIYAAYSFQK